MLHCTGRSAHTRGQRQLSGESKRTRGGKNIRKTRNPSASQYKKKIRSGQSAGHRQQRAPPPIYILEKNEINTF